MRRMVLFRVIALIATLLFSESNAHASAAFMHHGVIESAAQNWSSYEDLRAEWSRLGSGARRDFIESAERELEKQTMAGSRLLREHFIDGSGYRGQAQAKERWITTLHCVRSLSRPDVSGDHSSNVIAEMGLDTFHSLIEGHGEINMTGAHNVRVDGWAGNLDVLLAVERAARMYRYIINGRFYADGNIRTAIMAANVILLRAQLPPLTPIGLRIGSQNENVTNEVSYAEALNIIVNSIMSTNELLEALLSDARIIRSATGS